MELKTIFYGASIAVRKNRCGIRSMRLFRLLSNWPMVKNVKLSLD